MKEMLAKIKTIKLPGTTKYFAILGLLVIACIIMALCTEESSGPLKAPSSASYYRGENYQEAIQELKAAGFTNIKTEAIDDLIVGFLTKDGEIEEISIDGNKAFEEGDGFEKNAEVVITYHTFPDSDDNPQETPKPEETPEIKLSTALETAVWNAVKNNGGTLSSIETVTSEKNSSERTVVAAVHCKNDEKTVKAIAGEISEAINKNGEKTGVVLTIGELSDDDDPTMLAMVTITSDGKYEIASMSDSYNSERNLWIRGQFSGWDGSHSEFKDLVKSRLNDERSFKHIETTYIDVSDEETKDKANAILRSSGHTQRVEVGDLLITMEFSAKNAFNATIKNTAIGIASYKNNTIELVDIG